MLRKGQRGAALVEFAIIFPLLMVLVFGIIEFGILLYDKAMITNASREGARYGILFAPQAERCDVNNLSAGRIDDIKERVNKYAEDHLISFGPGTTMTITSELVGADVCGSGARLKVTVVYPFHYLIFSNLISLIGGNIAEQLDLTAITVMRME